MNGEKSLTSPGNVSVLPGPPLPCCKWHQLFLRTNICVLSFLDWISFAALLQTGNLCATIPCRPYVRLSEYEIIENRELLQWKFKSAKKAGCSGRCCITPGEIGKFV